MFCSCESSCAFTLLSRSEICLLKFKKKLEQKESIVFHGDRKGRPL